MAAAGDMYFSVIDVVNQVRVLLHYNQVTRLDQDSYCDVHLRLLNNTVDEISNYGDWQELYGVASVTVQSSVFDYQLGLNVPIQRIYEVALSGVAQSLYFITIEEYNQRHRSIRTAVGTPRMWTIRGADQFGNPKFSVFQTPGPSDATNVFQVTYYEKPGFYDKTSADDIIPFPGNVCIAGLYAAALVEESGGQLTKESMDAYAHFQSLMERAQQRHTTDSGTDTRIVPKYTGRTNV